MHDLADKLSSSNRFCSAGFQCFLRENVPLMLQDGEYSYKSLIAQIKTKFVCKLLEESRYFNESVQDVVEEVTKIVGRGSVSHLVIYGRNRIQVLAGILYYGPVMENLPIILSERAIEKEVLIARRIGNELPLETIKSLPDVLDFPFDASLGTTPGLLEELYVSGRLSQPYQIDTERYPF